MRSRSRTLKEQMLARLNPPAEGDEYTTPVPVQRLKSGTAPPEGSTLGDPLADALSEKLGIPPSEFIAWERKQRKGRG